MRRAHSLEMMLVIPDGIQAPYFTDTLTDYHNRKYLQDHDEQIASVDHYVVIGDTRAGSSLVALVAMAEQHTLWSRVFCSHTFSDEILLNALGWIAGITRDDAEFDAENVAVDI